MRRIVSLPALLAWLASPVTAQSPTLWISDDARSTVYHVTLTGVLLESFPTVDDARSSIAIDRSSDTLWGASEGRQQIVNYSKSGQTIAVIDSLRYDRRSREPEGADVDESSDTLWVVDDVTRRVSNIRRDGRLISFFRTTDYDSEATSTQAVAWDPSDGSLWLTDNSSHKIYNVTTGGRILSAIQARGFEPGISNLQGISVDRTDGSLWVTARDTHAFYHITRAGALLSRISTTSFGSDDPTGIAFDVGASVTRYVNSGCVPGPVEYPTPRGSLSVGQLFGIECPPCRSGEGFVFLGLTAHPPVTFGAPIACAPQQACTSACAPIAAHSPATEWSTRIPNDSRLIGACLCIQCGCFDRTVPCFTLSGAIRACITR